LFGVSKALEVLHSHQIFYGNVTLVGILLNDRNEPMLSGFERARIVGPHATLPDLDKSAMSHAAPELVNHSAFGVESDIFAFGLLMYEVLMATQLTVELTDLVRAGRKLPFIKTPEYAPYGVLLEQCLQVQPSLRPTAAAIAQALASQRFAATLSSPEVAAYARKFTLPATRAAEPPLIIAKPPTQKLQIVRQSGTPARDSPRPTNSMPGPRRGPVGSDRRPPLDVLRPSPPPEVICEFDLEGDFEHKTDLTAPWRIFVHRATQTSFMVKEIKTTNTKELSEYRSHQPYTFPSIAPFIGFANTAHGILLFREWIQPPPYAHTPRGDLSSLLRNDLRIDESRTFIILLGVAKAIEHIHARGMIHGNLRSSNVLLNEAFEPYVVGYGVSTTARARQGLEERSKGETSLFCAPEICSFREFRAEGDIFAYGTLLYLLHRQQVPDDDTMVRRMIIEGKRPVVEDGVPAPYRELLQKCWSQGPAHRPTARDVVSELLSPKFKTQVKHQQLSQYLKLLGEPWPKDWQVRYTKHD
jgi:serine/threonine protein kinase